MPTPAALSAPRRPLDFLRIFSTTTRSSRTRKVLVGILLVAVFYLMSSFRPAYRPMSTEYDGDGGPDLVAVVNPLLCQGEDGFDPVVCNCRDPSIPYMNRKKLWRAHHQRMVDEAEAAPPNTNVVFLGDSIMERLNGTRLLGHQQAYFKIRREFQRHFQTNNIRSLVLGSSGDTTGLFLWHLQHQLLAETLNPKVFVLVIGTNNQGRDGCNARTTLAGILQVMKVVHDQKPSAKILVHGLLPCQDQVAYVNRTGVIPDNGPVLETGRQWVNAQWINAELKKMCSMFKYCEYMESGEMYLTESGMIEKELMSDGLHPSLEGYKKWIPRLLGRVELLLRKKRLGGKI